MPNVHDGVTQAEVQHKQDEIIACLLHKSTNLPIAGNDYSEMKSNIFVLQTIESDLHKINCVNKVDSFFI